MSKVICDICGTTYDYTDASCPICGWVQANTATLDADNLDLDFMNEAPMDVPESEAALPGAEEDVYLEESGEEFAEDLEDNDFDEGYDDEYEEEEAEEDIPAPVPARKNKAIFDFDAVNEGREDAAEQSSAGYEDSFEEEEEPRVNVFLVIFLVIVIVALLLTSGFIFFKFFLPGRMEDKNATSVPVANAEIVEPTTEATIPTVPCTNLVLPNGIDVLTQQGQLWLLHVSKVPEDTTDMVVYSSSNESVATVSEDGRVTAVGEGEAVITVFCGSQQISCPVTVRYEEETEPAGETAPMSGTVSPTEATVDAEQVEETDAVDETEPVATVNPDAVLKLKKTDITLGLQGVYVDLTLEGELSPEDVEWFTSNSNIAVVKNGRVTSMGPGIAKITAKYGDQEVTCIVRCNF